MNIESANRYANLLTYIIDKKVRMEGRNVSLYKSDILFILKNNISERQEITAPADSFGHLARSIRTV